MLIRQLYIVNITTMQTSFKNREREREREREGRCIYTNESGIITFFLRKKKNQWVGAYIPMNLG